MSDFMRDHGPTAWAYTIRVSLTPDGHRAYADDKAGVHG